MPNVSLIVPVYNCAEYLRRCVDSILGQTFSDFEVLLVDDGSTDASGALCDEYAAADSRIRAIHKENGGAGSARNRGLEEASGEFLMFPDADDWLEPNMLEALLQRQAETGADVVICGYTGNYSYLDLSKAEVTRVDAAFYSTKEEVRSYFVSLFPEGVVGYLWNKLYRAGPIRENGLRFPDMRRYQDGVFNLYVFTHAGSCALLDKELYHYKLNDIADVFVKFPKNLYELTEQFIQAYESTLESWGFLTSAAENRILTFYGNSVVGCLDSMYSEKWHFTGRERKAYIQGLLEKPRLQQALARLDHIEGLSRYVRLALSLLKKKRTLVLRGVIRIKLWVKKHCRGLFQRLKRL